MGIQNSEYPMSAIGNVRKRFTFSVYTVFLRIYIKRNTAVGSSVNGAPDLRSLSPATFIFRFYCFRLVDVCLVFTFRTVLQRAGLLCCPLSVKYAHAVTLAALKCDSRGLVAHWTVPPF